ncbi:MAG: hypothetical protein L0206_13520 [Actinobacteria bacterium]|nr:hypothetical protein [Actinomycetota bacterium]
MSELEKRARPHLHPLVDGVTTRITPVAKEAVATWAMKTAMMLGFRFGKPPSPHLARWFMENQEPNRNSVVCIGYLNPGPQLVGIDGIEHGETQGFVAGLGLGRLALLVFLNPQADYRLYGPAAYEDVLFEVWPIDLEGIDWPPSLGMSSTHLNLAKVGLRKLITDAM